MTSGKDDLVLRKAIEHKDVADIKNILTAKLDLDPRFETGAFDADLKYLQADHPDIYKELVEPYRRLDELGEGSKLKKEEWSKTYFHTLTEWLRANFAPNERVPLIKQVGEAVYPLMRTPLEPEVIRPTPVKEAGSLPKKPNRQHQSNLLPALIAVAAVLAGIFFVIKALLGK